MLTPRELQQIREYLLQYGKKDSQFPVVETMTDNDLVAFVRNNQNLAAHLSDIKDFIGTEIAIGGIDIEGITMGLSEKNFSALLESKLGNIEPNAQVNKLETVKVNGTSLPITDKSVNVELIPTSYVKNYSDPIHPIGELGNQLLGERDINAKIAESEAEFKGTTSPDLTLAQFKTWLGNLTADRNDYVFYVATYTDERVDSDDDKYIYYRYKYTGAEEDTDGTPWPCVAGWIYEYQLIPYYLNTDEYPTANSQNAVESQGILAFTGNVKYDSVGERYISLQEQIDNIVAGGVTVTFAASASTVFVGGTYTLTATSSETSNSIQIKQGSTVIKEVANNTTATTDAITASNAGSTTYTALFQINSSVAKTLSKTVTAVEHIYYGKVSSKSITSLTGLSQRNTPSSTGAGDYTLSSGTSNYYFALVVPSNLTQPTQYGFPGSLPSDLEILSDLTVSGVTYKCYVSDKEQMANPSSVTFKVI